MRIVIAGGHGQIARLLHPLLVEQGHSPVALVRNPDHADAVRALGAEPLVLDLEKASVTEVATALEGAEAVVFAAGAGPDSGPERKRTLDRDGAVLLAAACEEAGVRRYLMVSSMGTGSVDRDSDDVFQVYLAAKADADDDLRSRSLDWTIVHPGRLTDDPPTGRVRVGASLPYGEVPRADVAAVLAACLSPGASARDEFDLTSGDLPVHEAVAGARRGPDGG